MSCNKDDRAAHLILTQSVARAGELFASAGRSQGVGPGQWLGQDHTPVAQFSARKPVQTELVHAVLFVPSPIH